MLPLFRFSFRDIRKKSSVTFLPIIVATCGLALPAPHDGRIQKLNLIFCL